MRAERLVGEFGGGGGGHVIPIWFAALAVGHDFPEEEGDVGVGPGVVGAFVVTGIAIGTASSARGLVTGWIEVAKVPALKAFGGVQRVGIHAAGGRFGDGRQLDMRVGIDVVTEK